MITEEVAKQLEQGLDRIFAEVRNGNLADLKGLLADLEAVLETAGTAHGPRVAERVLAGLRRKAERNAVCLKGAARGLRSARRRIAEVRAAAVGHGAYDATGQRLDPAAASARVNRRF